MRARLITRRRVLMGVGGVAAAGLALAGYGTAWEPMSRPRVTHYRLTPSGWPAGLRLKIAVIADVHACEPFMSAERIAGLGDQLAFVNRGAPKARRYTGVDDLGSTMAKITDDAPVILLAHEPDIFPQVPARVALTLSGHTHGGQIRLFGYSPVVPSRFGNRFAYGHVIEEGQHLIVSGGLGCSIMPVRFGSPPEIVVVELGETA